MTEQAPPTPPPSGQALADNLMARRFSAAGATAIPWLFLGLELLLAPGYLLPMFRHPVAGPIIIGTLIVGLLVSALSWFLMQRSQNPTVWVLAIIFIIMPQTIASLGLATLGPAVVTIVQALGPVFGDSK